MGEALGLTEALSIALGGMIGGGIYAVLGVVGLDAITAFASLAFIVVFGAVSAIAFANRETGVVHPVPPAVGLLGTAAFLPLMVWHLATNEPETLLTVLALAVAVVAVELAYFERSIIEREVARVSLGE